MDKAIIMRHTKNTVSCPRYLYTVLVRNNEGVRYMFDNTMNFAKHTQTYVHI